MILPSTDLGLLLLQNHLLTMRVPTVATHRLKGTPCLGKPREPKIGAFKQMWLVDVEVT